MAEPSVAFCLDLDTDPFIYEAHNGLTLSLCFQAKLFWGLYIEKRE